MVGVQLPDGQSLERTAQVVGQVDRIIAETPGIAHRVTIGGISLLDNSATLPNAAVFYVIFSSFEERTPPG